MKINDIKFDNLVVIMLSLIVLFIFSCMMVSDYMSYLSGKETRNLIREAITRNMSEETINTLIK
jgi:hypothetical protein